MTTKPKRSFLGNVDHQHVQSIYNLTMKEKIKQFLMDSNEYKEEYFDESQFKISSFVQKSEIIFGVYSSALSTARFMPDLMNYDSFQREKIQTAIIQLEKITNQLNLYKGENILTVMIVHESELGELVTVLTDPKTTQLLGIYKTTISKESFQI